MRREVFLVFKETIDNVARHAGCTEAAIDFRMDGHWLELSVRDNGKGSVSVTLTETPLRTPRACR